MLKGRRSTEQRRKESGLESKRWLEQSVEAEAQAAGTVLIHVEDREADIYDSFDARCRRGMHFIVRALASRMIDVDDQIENILVRVLIAAAHTWLRASSSTSLRSAVGGSSSSTAAITIPQRLLAARCSQPSSDARRCCHRDRCRWCCFLKRERLARIFTDHEDTFRSLNGVKDLVRSGSRDSCRRARAACGRSRLYPQKSTRPRGLQFRRSEFCVGDRGR